MKKKLTIRNKKYKIKTRKRKRKNTNKSDNSNKSRRTNLRTLQPIMCSPKDKRELNSFSCYTDSSLYKLRDRWNERHPDVKITTNNTRDIHKFLSSQFDNICQNEYCWLKQESQIGSSMDLKGSFAPERPKEWKKNPNEWLSSIDITSVMNQYEKAYKCFDFIGPSPIDFEKRQLYGECVWEELCNFNLSDQIKKGKTKIGIIFNTDPHDAPGEHWISLFININKKSIYFFDSVGRKIRPQIMDFVNNIKEQGQRLQEPILFKFDQNYPVEHQYGETECGIYSLFFITHMLEDKITEHYLKTHILKDKYMEKFRKVYFNDNL